ncbi:MAG: GIY-YIG nuclease family protein [Candidatus Omnitrophica bacterium]|nr:GIY-YIG nuclease family protein [Candidatus Omnitrophota bacterium]
MSAPLRRDARCWVYIVRCADGTYYTGYTSHLRERIRLHNAGRGAKYVRGRGPVRLVYAKAFRSFRHAAREEYRLKQLRRAQKAALIR